jgi:hypothetical protein
MVKYKVVEKEYKIFAGKSEKPTRKYFTRILVMLSSCEVIKMRLNPKEITLAEFAEYINLFNDYQNQLKISRNRVKSPHG